MNLKEKRLAFTMECLPALLTYANAIGYELAIGEAKRGRAQAIANAASGRGIRNSLHRVGLAVDMNLYINGEYQRSTAAHEPLGLFWEQMGASSGYPLHWGGRFSRPDGNHYSFGHNGIK